MSTGAGSRSSLARLADEVLSAYPIRPRKVVLFQSSGMKTVWKVAASDGRAYGLKRLRHGKDQMLFAIQAHRYLQGDGGLVPRLTRTRDGKLYEERNDGQMFILFDWVDGRQPSFDNASDLRKAVRLLARFHKASAGFRPQIACRESTKLGKWPSQYETMMERMREWQADSSTGSSFPELVSAAKPYWNDLLRVAERARRELSRSDYDAMSRKGPDTLCHQDYSEGNVLLSGDGGWVLDMDSVTYDFPARDLRKVVLKRMLEKGRWDDELFRSILSAYLAVFPLSREQLELVYIDLSFPHLFHETAKNPFRNNSSISVSKLMTVIRIEQQKASVFARYGS